MKIFTLLMLMALLQSCGNYTSGSPIKERPLVTGADALNFATVKNAILTPNCINCHQQYANYESVKRELSAIKASIDSGRMPKFAPALRSDLKGLLDKWIAEGAPNTTSAGPSPVNVLEPTWKSVSENILFAKCTVCHNPSGQAQFLDLSQREAVFFARNNTYSTGQKLIDFESPDESYLLAVVQDDVSPMPPPPPQSNYGRLGQAEISVLREWIRLGLP